MADSDSEYSQMEYETRHMYPCGAPETSTPEIRHNLLDRCKKEILSKYNKKIENENISIDCDAISVVITTPDMTTEKKKAIRDFLLVFGSESATSCGIPQSATGHGNLHSIFSCYGEKCQHLPELLDDGEEMIVLDTPIKLGLHESCKKKLVNALRARDIHLSPATDRGICFSTDAAANKPPYAAMIDSIIESCQFGLTHMIHVADFGFKLSIDELADQDNIVPIFDQMKVMSDLGISVELAQIDIAFVAHAPKNMLLQMSMVKHTMNNEESEESLDEHNGFDESLIDDATLFMYPLHQLDIQGGNSMKECDFKGGFLLRKQNQVWEERKNITLSPMRDAIQDFLPDNAQDERSGESHSQNINTSTIYSLKVYSTIAHPFLQRRNKLPMSTKSMYGTPNRSISYLQNLLTIIENAKNDAFYNDIDHGYGMRIEFSIRPTLDEPLRTKGHYNDVLLHVCLAMEDFCRSKRYTAKLHHIRLREVETRSMELLSQARALLRFRHERKFNEIYSHPKVSAWLRSHLSMLLITVGVCPEFGTKYINSWLNDEQRYDPHELIPTPVEDNSREREDLVHRIISKVFTCCRNVFKCDSDAEHLANYIRTFITQNPHVNAPNPHGELEVRSCYRMLSLQCKLHLSESMMESIIPHISELLPETNDEDDMENMENNEDMENEEFNSITNSRLEMIAMPKDPIGQAIYALMQISCIASHERTGFTSSLCYYILKSHGHIDLGLPNIAPTTTSILEKHIKGERFTRESLKHLIANLDPSSARARNISKKASLEKLCKIYLFPCMGLIFPPLPENGERNDLDNIRNELLNDALEVDLIVILNKDARSLKVYRNADDAIVTIKSIDSIVHRNSSAEFIPTRGDRNLYAVLAHTFNTIESMLRQCLHDKIKKKMEEEDIRNVFLTDEGTRDTNFSDATTLDSIQTSKEFLFISNSGKIIDMIWYANHPPEIIIPFTAWMYEIDIIFYDYTSSTTHIFANHDSRLITYVVDNISILPKKKHIIIARTQDDIYESRVVATFTTLASLGTSNYANNIFHFGPLGGRRLISTNYATAVGQKITRKKSFYSAITEVCRRIDQDYFPPEAIEVNGIQTSQQKDPLHILPYIKELSSSRKRFEGFSKKLEQICGIENLPLISILSNFQSMSSDDWTHLMLCPFLCIKYKMSIGILTQINKVKKTYLYGFDNNLQQVQCELCDGYTTLDDIQDIIYLVQTPRQAIIPATSLNVTKHFHQCLHTKYSYLDPHTFKTIIHKLGFGLGSVFYDRIVEEADFRPENYTVQIHTNITCYQNTSSLAQILQHEVNHRALILIFPCEGDEAEWNTCIVHHRFQHPSSAMSVLTNTFDSAIGGFRFHSIAGREIEDCDSGFHMILYALIGHRLRCFEKFKKAIRFVAKEKDISSKLHRWVYRIANNKNSQIPEIPTWIQQILQRVDTDCNINDDIQMTTFV